MSSRILPTLALMLSVAIFFAYINPTWSESIAETKTAITANNDALAAAREFEAKKNELASARNNIDPGNLARLEKFLPDSVDNVGLILDVNALAARSGLSLSNLDVTRNELNNAAGSVAVAVSSATTAAAPTVRGNPVGSADLSLTAIGTYKALKDFLVGLEKSARLLDVRDITVKSSDTGVYNYQMAIRLYWLR